MTKVPYNSTIHSVALSIIEKRKREGAYANDCLKAGICAKCGAQLAEVLEEWEDALYTLRVQRCTRCGFTANREYIY